MMANSPEELEIIRLAWKDRLQHLQQAMEDICYLIRTEGFIADAIEEHPLEISKVSAMIKHDEITAYCWIGFENNNRKAKMQAKMEKINEGLVKSISMGDDPNMETLASVLEEQKNATL